MTSSWWPLSGLRVRSGRIELRLPGPAELDQLADLAAAGIHDPEVMPFFTPWTDAPPDQRARSVMQWHWRQWAAWTPAAWNLEFAVIADGVVVGCQAIAAREFATCREVSTGSWLGRRFQRRGIGSQMRAAALHLAFDGLGALWATSGAFEDNLASLGVSRKLGYRDDGIDIYPRRNSPAVLRRLRLDQATWRARPPSPLPQITGLAACRHMFGLAAVGADAQPEPASAPLPEAPG